MVLLYMLLLYYSLKVHKYFMNRDSVVCTVARLLTGQQRNCGSYPGMGKIFLFSKGSRPSLESTRHCIQSVPGYLVSG